MTRWLGACVCVATILVADHAISATSVPARTSSDHVTWVAETLTRMETIKPGMTRKDLLLVFTTEGGISTGLQRTFVSRDCPYFKVDVRFEPVGRPSRDPQGRATLVEDDRDVIAEISKPYLQRPVTD